MPVLENAKHEAVAAAYIRDPQRIGWKAYVVVYPDSSEKAARTAWSRLLKIAGFSARIAELKAAAADSAVMDLREVLTELSKLGRSSIKKCLVRGDDTSDVVESLNDMSDDDAAAIKSMTIETYVEGHGDDKRDVKRLRIDLHDKRGALAELRRHHEPQKHEHTGKDGEAIEVKAPTSDLEVARRIAFLLSSAARVPAERPAAAAVTPEKEPTDG